MAIVMFQLHHRKRAFITYCTLMFSIPFAGAFPVGYGPFVLIQVFVLEIIPPVQPEAGSGLLPVVAVPSESIFAVQAIFHYPVNLGPLSMPLVSRILVFCQVGVLLQPYLPQENIVPESDVPAHSSGEGCEHSVYLS